MQPPSERLFDGPASVRAPGENGSLVFCIAFAPVVIALISIFLPSLSISEFILLIAAGLVFVAVARGRLIGSSIRVEPRQFPELAHTVDDFSARLGIVPPQVFMRDDQQVPIAAVGVGEPYSLMISSQYYELLHHGELAFLIARELGHIAAGHTRLSSLLSASGRENPIVALVFGAWLRRTETTADRIGVLCCNDLEEAFGAICVTTFHAVGRRVDRTVLAEQRADIAADPALRLGELISGVPYATNRLDALRAFVESPLAAFWRRQLREPVRRDNVAPVVVSRDVERADVAPLHRRIGAAIIDIAVISATTHAPAIIQVRNHVKGDEDSELYAWVMGHLPLVHLTSSAVFVILIYFLYSAVLVSLVGQTLGMTVFDVRVVTTNFKRPGVAQSIWRYAVGLAAALSSIALIGFFLKIHPHDRLSKTRLVRARRLP